MSFVFHEVDDKANETMSRSQFHHTDVPDSATVRLVHPSPGTQCTSDG